MRGPLFVPLSLLLLSAALAAGAAEPAPQVQLFDLHAQAFPLDALRGEVVLLDFWASWCGPCRKSFPFLDALQEKYRSRGLKVVGVTLEEDDDAVAAFLRAVPVGFPIVRDTTEKAGEAFGVVAMPTTFLLDREGRIAARFEGGDDRVHDRIRAAVESLLAGQPLPPGSDVRVSEGVEATGKLRAWERSYLADPIMSLDGDPLGRVMKDHIHASKEAAAGDGGASGGGCGCN